MAKPISYRKVGKGSKQRCENCKHFVDSNSWCAKWKFVADEEYICSKWVEGLGELAEESELKKQYRIAAGDDIIVREENYAKPYTPTPKSDNYRDGFMYRFFCKQKNNPYGDIIEISEKSYTSAGSVNTGIDGSHYDTVKVQWTISGRLNEVIKTNTKIADYIESRHPKMKGLREYLYSNLQKFWEGRK
tara:strand:+ start:60 stop:626 length:567 start_codon:yes stop_codon:yes gene_type:complete